MRPLLVLSVIGLFLTGHVVAQVNYAKDLVNPFVGTGGHGHTFPGACVPNGLVQLSPDTRPDGYMDWDGCGGYHYSDSLIYGFSHTHLSGTGVADLCDVLLMPVTGEQGASWLRIGYRQKFSHTNERAHAGYYQVRLNGGPAADYTHLSTKPVVPLAQRDPIDVELTATAHVGVHRYTFPDQLDARMVLDLRHRDKVLHANMEVVSPTEVVGERSSSSWAKDQKLFFCIRFSAPMKMDVQTDNLIQQAASFNFGKLTQPLVVKVGISSVSVEGARKNLDAEVPAWDFDAVRTQAENAWNAKLSKVQVTGGTKDQQRTFYSALYHCYVAPYVFSDVDGNYRGMDGAVHHADHKVYTVFSLWDTFRALHPLMTILEPEMTNDFIKTFLMNYQQGGKLPVWELWGNETNCMIGYHSVSVIADAYMKGIRGFDAELALKAMVASAMADDPCLNAYRTRGYISSEDCSESVSKTLEYAYDDWCIARMAKEMGRDSLAQVFFARSRNWQNLFDPQTKFFRARRNGGFIEPFDPYEVNFNYTEANAWQYSMFVPHDLPQYTQYMGTAFYGHLNELFSTHSGTTGRDQADITGSIGQYAQGNEPSHHMAYLYRSAPGYRQVHSILSSLYNAGPDGLSGNEDCGQMSAWYVMSAMGIYPVSPGCDRYWTGATIFDQIAVDLPNGKRFMVVADQLKPAVSKAGHPEPWPSISHATIMNGTTLSLADGPEWDNAPSPFRTDLVVPPAPIISAASSTFRDSIVVNVTALPGPWKVMVNWGWDGDDQIFPGSTDQPVVLHSSGWVDAFISETGSVLDERAIHVKAHFSKIDDGRTIKLDSKYANQYAAGGDNALIDGLRGGQDFRTGQWQGYQGQDVIATIDLGKTKTLKRAGVSMLQDQGSWIWFPEYVDIAWSSTGRTWSSVTLKPNVDRKADGGRTLELWSELIGKKAQYIKIMAKNAGPCPDWHPGNGGASWIFLDEVLIEAE